MTIIEIAAIVFLICVVSVVLVALVSIGSPKLTKLPQRSFYVIDLNYHDLLEDPDEDLEPPFFMYATGPFPSYTEAQDYGNRNHSFFGVTELI